MAPDFSKVIQPCLQKIHKVHYQCERKSFRYPSQYLVLRMRSLLQNDPNTKAVMRKYLSYTEEVCDIIFITAQYLSSLDILLHLLFQSGSFSNFEQIFPTKVFQNAVKSFPSLDETKLYSELSVIYPSIHWFQAWVMCWMPCLAKHDDPEIYGRPDFKHCCRAAPSLQLIIGNSLVDTFS